MSTYHYLIHATGKDGRSQNLVVEANAAGAATRLWRKWRDGGGRGATAGSPVVYRIPVLTGVPRFLEWGVDIAADFPPQKRTRRVPTKFEAAPTGEGDAFLVIRHGDVPPWFQSRVTSRKAAMARAARLNRAAELAGGRL